MKGVGFHAKTGRAYDVTRHSIDTSKLRTKVSPEGHLCILRPSCALRSQMAKRMSEGKALEKNALIKLLL